jgi:hypothetical protein
MRVDFCQFINSSNDEPIYVNPLLVRCIFSYEENLTHIVFDDSHTIVVRANAGEVERGLTIEAD